MRFRKIKKSIQAQGTFCCAFFLSFRTNSKSIRVILKINILVDMILQTMDKTVSYL